MDLVPVSVLTGFLGSGKTTVLNHLVRQPAGARMAVVINEFGEIGLDHDLVARADETVVELTSGCVCCTVRGDLIEALRSLYLRRARQELPRFERVVIETTGLADPAPVLHVLMGDPMLSSWYRLDGVIATVDAINGSATLDNHVEAVRQAAVADRIVLTKTDLCAAPEPVAHLRERLRAINPGAPTTEALDGVVPPEWLFDAGLYDPRTKTADVQGWLRAEAYPEPAAHGSHHGHHHHHHHDPSRHDDHIRAHCIVRDRPIALDVLVRFFTDITTIAGPDFLRIKGIVNIAERPETPAVVHGVQHVFHPLTWLDDWPSADRRTRMVFITQGIPRQFIESALESLS